MSRSTDAKRREVLKYIISRHTEPTVTSLMKIAYLADLLALKQGSRITDYKYIRYYYGPFDRAIYMDIDSLIQEGYVESKATFSGQGDGGEYYVFKSTDKSKDEEPSMLSVDEKKLLGDLLNDIRGYGAKTLTDAAYKTKPMKKLGATLGGNENLNQPLKLDV